MTLKGLFALWRTRTALDPVRFDVAALGAKTSDLPSLARRARRAARRRSCGSRSRRGRAWRRGCSPSREFRATREMVVGGLVIGAVIVGGWYVSGHLGYLAEDPATLEEKIRRHQLGPRRVVQLHRRRSRTCSSC